ncbi:MAG: DUF6734 family protein [Mucilaginibacter sp.]|uniref:DUF6734 family protein n=1 Tax=Mucilaginibacter sp. TaxID=1882438 RepID=UPI0034E4140E
MKKLNVVQSFYLFPNGSEPITQPLGFLSPEFHWMSWCLSCLQIIKLYHSVTLYTNELGNEVLIKQLKLPYSKVVITQNNYPAKLWAMNKIHTYSLQQEPFLHVDGDVFLWKELGGQTQSAGLIAQNVEVNDGFYQTILKEYQTREIVLPEPVAEISNANKVIRSCNAGVLGGSDLAFFKEYTQLATTFVAQYQEKLNEVTHKDVNIVFEQLFFYRLAEQRNKAIKYVLEDEISDMTYPGIINFLDIPHKTKFIHMLGTYKKSEEACKMLAKRLRTDYPDHYYFLLNVLKKQGLKMYYPSYNENPDIPSIQDQVNSYDWNKIYQEQHEQYHLYDQAFGNSSEFLETNFVTNNLVYPETTDALPANCMVPCSLEMKFKKREIDELDSLIMELLKEVKPIATLLEDLKNYFEPEDYTQEKEALLELLMLKLRKGCEDNMFLIVDRTDLAIA